MVRLRPNQSLDTIIEFLQEGNYFIHQRLTGATGCITEDTLTIKLLAGIDQNIKPEINYAGFINDSMIEVSWKPVQYATKYQLRVNNKNIILNSNQINYQFKDLIKTQPNLLQLYAIDTCGNSSLGSETTKTVYLTAKLINNDYNILHWTPYEYWTVGVLSYEVERKVGNRTNWEKIMNMDNNFQATDELNNFDTVSSCEICYRVVAKEKGNNFMESKSNIACTYLKPTVFVPNAFSPNNDGLNDFFKPFGTGIDSYEIFIYDRWGELVYEGKTNSGGWDGKLINDELAPEGVYIYSIQTINKNLSQIQKVLYTKGTIILTR